MVYMIESQIEHVCNAVRAIDDSGAAVIEVTREAHEAFNRDVDARLRGTVWDQGGCSSFYIDESGRNATSGPTGPGASGAWPGAQDLDGYHLSERRPAEILA